MDNNTNSNTKSSDIFMFLILTILMISILLYTRATSCYTGNDFGCGFGMIFLFVITAPLLFITSLTFFEKLIKKQTFFTRLIVVGVSVFLVYILFLLIK